MTRKAIAGFALLVLGAASCGTDATNTASQADAGAPTVVATTSIWGDVVSNVACTDQLNVVTIIPRGADPHSFEISLADRAILDDAALIVQNGLFLEEGLVDTIEAVEAEGVAVFTIADHVETIEFDQDSHDEHGHEDEEHEDEHEDEEHEDEDHDEHGHGSVDPHVWFDPLNVSAALPELAAEIVTATGLDEGALDSCVESFTAELDALDSEVAASLASIPEGSRSLVTNHDALGYFAAHYDLDILGTVIPDPSGLGETNAADLEELRETIAEAGVSAIFAETQSSTDDIDALASALDGVDVVTLQVGTLGDEGSESETYVDWLQYNADLISEALS